MKNSRWPIPALTISVPTLVPWVLWAIYQFHKPDHADVFWLPAMPLSFIFLLPMWLIHGGGGPNWFPVDWVALSSAFNLVFAASIWSVVLLIKKKTSAQEAE